ncbi:P-II family nitrogen regulator [Treponema sp.]|uniref:P-II family nitrogen regulator n=1 Tax=Treponema sp. TaxID=166 RepID=UPI0025E4FEE5|nr:P-II family nitrogen regulator [Treponema sp.]MCR5217076.1 P-II family nitrogen regulator [Treponema sp.]
MEKKFSRVEVITGISKITALQKALGKFHITGMTVYQVLGCGVQHGTQEFEVEEARDIQLLPKEVVMMVLPSDEVSSLIEFLKKELYTGHIGDGKIFVSDITNIVRVRTGEEGMSALIKGE